MENGSVVVDFQFICSLIYLLKMVILHSDVKLQEGITRDPDIRRGVLQLGEPEPRLSSSNYYIAITSPWDGGFEWIYNIT